MSLYRSSDTRRGAFLRFLGTFAISLIGWFLTLGSFQLWQDLRLILEDENAWLDEGLVFLTPAISLANTVGLKSSSISDEQIERLRATPGVRNASPVIRNEFPVVVEIGGGVFPSLASEIFLEALPDDFILRSDQWNWKEGDKVPVLLPRLFIHLYNFGFAPGKGLPPVSEGSAGRVPITLLLYPSDGSQPVSRKARIDGFSDRINGPLVPAEFLNEMNRLYGGGARGTGRVAATVSDAGAAEFLEMLERNDLEASGGSDSARLRFLLDGGMLVLGGAGALILLLNLLLLRSQIETFLERNRDRFGKLYFLGHSPGALLRGILLRRIPVVIAPAIGGLCLVFLARLAAMEPLRSAGLDPEESLRDATLFLAAAILAAATVWLTLRIRGRLRGMF